MRLLIVEDEDSIRSAMVRAMIQSGHTVSAASSLGAARTILAELPTTKRPEALLSDLKLPDGSGLDLARELGVPFVLMSGFAGFDDAVMALRLGCVDFFTKPVAIKDIRRALATVEQRLAGSRSSGPVVVDPAGTMVQVVGDVAVSSALSVQTATWSGSPVDAVSALFVGSSLAERRALAELAQCPGTTRLVLNRGPVDTRIWAGGAHQPSPQAARILAGLGRLWEGPEGLLLAVPASQASESQPAAGLSGELLWLCELPGGDLDLSQAVCLSASVIEALSGRRVTAAHPAILVDLAAAGITVAPSSGGVGNAERAALFGD
jgi:two-component system KDP operon response regulator KdpE